MKLIRGGLVCPVSSSPIADGAVVVEGAAIKAVGDFAELTGIYADCEYADMRDCVILPGLVNAHTHLELSHLRGRVPYEGSFVAWVERLQAMRWGAAFKPEEVIAEAVRESLRVGVTTVGDISSGHQSWRFLKKEPIRKRCYAEVFGMTAEVEEARAYIESCMQGTAVDEWLRQGLSPHAPYSAGPAVYKMAAAAADAGAEISLMTHLAENREELRFLRRGDGPWREYLEKLEKWDGNFACPGKGAVAYFLEMRLGKTPFALAHVNYLDEEEIEALRRTTHSVVYCPRSHQFFGHPEHPFLQMRAVGVNVALGTDSLASNETLSILDEIRFLHGRYPELPAGVLLEMATINGARALGWDDQIGTLEAGKDADIVVLPMGDVLHPALEQVMFFDSRPGMVMIRGEVVYHE